MYLYSTGTGTHDQIIGGKAGRFGVGDIIAGGNGQVAATTIDDCTEHGNRNRILVRGNLGLTGGLYNGDQRE